MMQQLDHERNLKLDAFERVEDLQRQVCFVFFCFLYCMTWHCKLVVVFADLHNSFLPFRFMNTSNI